MSTLAIDGLASGLDTTSIISQLMQVAANPQVLLQNKQTAAEKQITALQGINTNVLALSTAAKSAATAASWTSFTATSSSTSATVTTDATASEGSLTFSVDAVAKSQVSLTGAVTDGSLLMADNPPTMTIQKADGTYATVVAASNSLDDITAAINGADFGISATKVQVSGGATPSYRLQFTSETTGSDGAFQLYAGDQAAVQAGTATRLDSTVVTDATDASITLWKGTSAEQTFTQSSNTFTGLMTGVDVTIASVPADGSPITVSVGADSDAVKELASGLVSALNTALTSIATATKSSTSTSSGTTTVSGGVLTGDAAMRRLTSALASAAGSPVNGISPSSVGIIIERDGTFTFDEDVFASALEDDPEGTAAFIQEIASRLETVSDDASDKYDGSLTLQIKGKQSEVSDLEDQIDDWDLRLELRRSTLQAQFTSLETLMSNMTSQSNWLSSQIASLPSYDS